MTLKLDVSIRPLHEIVDFNLRIAHCEQDCPQNGAFETFI